jgi:AcrR family transcriptional regulator
MLLEQEAPWRLRRRQRIVDAASRLFAANPYGAVQMDDVARAAGVGKATLYRYFPSKEELYLAIFGAALGGLEQRLAEIAAARLKPSEALERLLRCLVELLGDQLRSLRLLDGESAELAAGWRSVMRNRRRVILDVIRSLLEEGMATGEFRNVDPDVTPALLVGMVRGGLMGAADVPRDRLADAVLALVLKGGLGA